jgi:two-component system cell cycle response regulator
MDGSILLIGDRAFLEAHLPWIRENLPCTLETVSSLTDAVSMIQAQQPDIVLIQADQENSLALCQHIKEQSRLAWIYTILVEPTVTPKPTQTALQHSQPSEAIGETERLQIEIRDLDAGADAVLWRSPLLDCPDPTHSVLPGTAGSLALPSPCESSLYWAKLGAQIQVGLRRVQNHRELMRTNDLLSTIALSDPLTELNNRRAFEWELPRQIKNARNHHTPVSLMVLDVDFFKHINDTYGHLVGDRALHLIAARLRHNLRFCDIPFRYGGEEFVVILSDTGAHDAFVVAQRICNLVADQPFAINETLDLQITISAGTATLTAEDDDRGLSLLNRADQNLLKAKSQGRNRVISSYDSYEQEGGNPPDPFLGHDSLGREDLGLGDRPQNPSCNCCASASGE